MREKMESEKSIYQKIRLETHKRDNSIIIRNLIVEKNESVGPIMKQIYSINENKYKGYKLKLDNKPAQVKPKQALKKNLLSLFKFKSFLPASHNKNNSVSNFKSNISTMLTTSNALNTYERSSYNSSEKKQNLTSFINTTSDSKIKKEIKSTFLTSLASYSEKKPGETVRVKPLSLGVHLKAKSYNLTQRSFDRTHRQEFNFSTEKKLDLNKKVSNTFEGGVNLENEITTRRENETKIKNFRKNAEKRNFGSLMEVKKKYYFSKNKKIDISQEKTRFDYMKNNFDKVVKLPHLDAFKFKDIIFDKFGYFLKEKAENNFKKERNFTKIKLILEKTTKKNSLLLERLNRKKPVRFPVEHHFPLFDD